MFLKAPLALKCISFEGQIAPKKKFGQNFPIIAQNGFSACFIKNLPSGVEKID